MARTPVAVRPIGRTSFSWKEMHLPLRVTMVTMSSPVVCWMLTSSSPSRRVIAMRPVFLWVLNSERAVFLMVPLRVTASRYLSSPFTSIGMTALMRSRCMRLRKLTAGVPFAVRVASGISYALILYALP